MTPRRETKWQRAGDLLRFVVIPNWKLSLIVVALAAIGLVFALQMRARSSGPSATQEGRIEGLAFQGTDSRTLTPRPIAIVRLTDGTTEEILASRGALANCRAGDRITYVHGPEGVRIDRCTP
jgi:DNA-binding transcriptional regulator of glucitol operon